MRARAYLVALVALVLASGAYGALGLVGGDPGDLQSALAKKDRHRSRLMISGHIKRLYPGDHRHIRVRLRNRRPYPVRVRWIRVEARHGARGCSKNNLRAPRRHYGPRRMFLRPHGTRQTGLPIRLRGSAPDTCQRVRFPLRFRAELRVNAKR